MRDDQLLTTAQAAKLLAFPPATLAYWRVKGHRAGPPFIRLGHRIRYALSDLREWIAAGRVTVEDEDVRISDVWQAIRSEAAMAEVSHSEMQSSRTEGTKPGSEAHSGVG